VQAPARSIDTTTIDPVRAGRGAGWGLYGGRRRKTVAGKYRLLELLGEGGAGQVFRARPIGSARDICVKLLRSRHGSDPIATRRFRREAGLITRLRNPHTIRILDVGSDLDGQLFIAMEYVDGKNLRELLQDETPVPEERACHIMAQVLSSLGEAHTQRILHRDLKPENIMIEQRPDAADFARVLDFGVAKSQDTSLTALTGEGMVCGTPTYMSPEQAAGDPIDGRSDLYSIGVLLYELLTGEVPFGGRNAVEIMLRHQKDPPVPPRSRAPSRDISAGMDRLILDALAKKPEDRPQTAEDFRRRLLQLREARLLERAQVKAAAS
jgi:serine/threonine-protein kinase